MAESVKFVLATSTVQWAGCLLLAGVLLSFYRSYRRGYLLHIAASWLALSFVFSGGVVAIWTATAGFEAWHPLRLGASLVSQVASYLQVVLLLTGSFEIARRRAVSPRLLLVLVAVCVVVGLLMPLLYLTDPGASNERYFIRFGLRSLAIGLAFVAGGTMLFRMRATRGLGARLVAAAFLLYGVEQVHYFGLTLRQLLTDRMAPYAAYLTFVDFFLLVVIGVGTIVWMLEAERDRLLRATREIDFLSNYDPLTGLPNRQQLGGRLELLLEEARISGEGVAVVALDLDGFRAVNDSLGRAAGDEILRVIGRRLGHEVADLAALARSGPDEYALAVRRIADEATLRQLLERLMASVRRPVHAHGQELYVTASAGAVLVRRSGDSAATVLRHAESALHAVQGAGRDGYLIYTPTLGALSADRLRFETSVRKAIEVRQFVLHFQPIVSLDSGRLTSFEALVRWQHPSRGLLAPDEFLGVAEAIGSLKHLEWWVLETACRQLARWRQSGADELGISVNLSPQRFQNPELIARVERVIADCSVPADRLQLEITEGSALQHTEPTLGVLQALRALGVRIAIDDFGIGYASLANLRTVPVDVVKIDRSFVRALGRGERDDAFVAAIVTMAHGLELPVIAEGVEREEQRETLWRLGCDAAQGYLFSPPLAADACSMLLEESRQPWRTEGGA